VEAYKDFLLHQPKIGRNTAQKYFDALKSLLRRAVTERLLLNNPAAYIKNIKVPDPQTYHLTLDELGILAKTPLGGELGAEVKKAFLFACYTGLRISDLRSLSWGDIQRDPLAISIIQQKTKERVLIPIAPIAWKIIDDRRLHKANEKVFPALSQSRTNLNQYLVAWAKKAGLEKPLGFHVARRTFGTFALQYGGDLATVSRLLGHTSLKHTQRYLKTDSEQARRVIEKLPAIEVEGAKIIPIRKAN
jgi:integrase